MNKILVVDDSKTILMMAKNLIASNLLNSHVEVADGPEKAMEILSNEVYHVVVLDIVMPVKDGIEVLEWIKQQDQLKNTKVIMFSSLDDGPALTRSFSLGAYDYIRKPLEEFEFLARVKHAVNEYKQDKIINRNFHEMALKNLELEDLNKTLKKTQSELVQSERLVGIGFLAAGMAHEINNPLGYIKSNVSILRENTTDVLQIYDNMKELIPEEHKEVVHDMEEAVSMDYILEDIMEIYSDIFNGISRMEDIISALRNFSRVDSHHDKEPVMVSEVFQNIKILTASRFEGKVDLQLNMDVESPLFCNKGDVNLSFMNLISNSFESIERKESIKEWFISVVAKEDEDQVSIIIEDNGCGMSEEVMRHAIDPFFTTKEVGDGAGLGLSTAYNCFVNVMKGVMKIDSNEDLGTKVTVILPIEKEK